MASPHNVFDATLAAGKYLCSGGLDLANPTDRAAAVFRYNHSEQLRADVLDWADAYANGVDPDAGLRRTGAATTRRRPLRPGPAAARQHAAIHDVDRPTRRRR